jgi:hypothetical protein
MVRTNVRFRHPTEFMPLSDEDGILAVGGAGWFASLLRRVPGLEIEDELCQEDWGVVIFARRNEKRFWIGLSMWADGEQAWLAHVHHRSFAWLQRLSASGNKELERLVSDIHNVLVADRAVSEIAWYQESDMSKPDAASFSTPANG